MLFSFVKGATFAAFNSLNRAVLDFMVSFLTNLCIKTYFWLGWDVWGEVREGNEPPCQKDYAHAFSGFRGSAVIACDPELHSYFRCSILTKSLCKKNPVQHRS